jgi:hypothetical protein
MTYGETHQIMWDSLVDYDTLEWQRTLQDLEKVVDVAYEDFLKDFDKV